MKESGEVNSVTESERELERERLLVPQRERPSHGLSAGSLLESAAAAHRLRTHAAGEKHRSKKEKEEEHGETRFICGGCRLRISIHAGQDIHHHHHYPHPSSRPVLLFLAFLHHHAGLAEEPHFLSAADARGR